MLRGPHCEMSEIVNDWILMITLGNLLVTLWIYGVGIRRSQQTGVDLKWDFSFDRD